MILFTYNMLFHIRTYHTSTTNLNLGTKTVNHNSFGQDSKTHLHLHIQIKQTQKHFHEFSNATPSQPIKKMPGFFLDYLHVYM